MYNLLKVNDLPIGPGVLFDRKITISEMRAALPDFPNQCVFATTAPYYQNLFGHDVLRVNDEAAGAGAAKNRLTMEPAEYVEYNAEHDADHDRGHNRKIEDSVLSPVGNVSG
jgi:hypothetical protein